MQWIGPNYWLLLLLWMQGELSADPTNPKVTVEIGVLRLKTGGDNGLPDRWFMPAIAAAGAAFKKTNPQVQMNFHEYYPLGVACASAGGTATLSNMYMKVYNYAKGARINATLTNAPVHAIIGPYCSAKVIPAAVAATTNQIVQITGGGEDIASVSAYTRLARTGYAKSYQYDIIVKYLLKEHTWKTFAVVYDSNLKATDVAVDRSIVVLLMHNTLIRQTLLAATSKGMTDGEYVFFALDQVGANILPTGAGHGWNVEGDAQNAAAMAAYAALLVIRIRDYTNDDIFLTNQQAIVREATSGESAYQLAQFGAYPTPVPCAFWNAAMLLGQMAKDGITDPTPAYVTYLGTVKSSTGDPFGVPLDDLNLANGKATVGTLLGNYMDYIFSSPENTLIPLIKLDQGIAGPCVVSATTSDLRESYELYAMTDTTNGIYKPYIQYTGLDDKFTVIATDYSWFGGSFPIDKPRCGYANDSKECALEQLIAIMCGVFVPLGFIAIFVGVQIYRRRHVTDLDPSLIAQMSELRVVHPDQTAELIEKAKQAREAVLQENYSVGVSEGSLSEKIISPSVGYWKRQAVIVRWSKKRSLKASPKMAMEIREAMEAAKENIAKLIGVGLDTNRIVLLYEYCSRGSVEESVNDPESKFEWPLRFSYINDIIRGMYFIHTSSLRVHGRLTSACCFIDSRFTVKITDAGLPTFFDLNLVEYWTQKRKLDFYYRQLWTAPEIMRERENNIDEAVNTATREGDTFSFGIILQEIIVHGPPYCMYNDDYTDQRIYDTVSKHPAPGGKPFRPTIDESLAHIEIIQLCEKCWCENAAERLTFSQIRVIMKDITKNLGMGDRLNIMETLIQQMEEHTMGLQAMIEEKEKLILEEKARGDFLLFSNLPPAYAEAFRTGEYERVRPIYFEVCSIVVVDIENFDGITAVSTASEIAQLLSDLHFYYSTETANFDCILLESIVQRVTVASGVPVRNGILHAREVARLALTLLYRSNGFVIPHLPDERISIRFGIHSGPIVSGVVGRRVPRFCLFGETLNVATRIMSVGKGLEIRLSAPSRNIIEAFGSFRAFDAGDVFVKGKGRLKTYTLVGEDGNHELMELKRKFGADSLLEAAHA